MQGYDAFTASEIARDIAPSLEATPPAIASATGIATGRITMLEGHLLGPFVRRFLDEVVTDRNLTINTQRSYRDSTQVFLRFLREHHGLDAGAVMVEQITAAVVRGFLVHLEDDRGNSPSTRNQRLKALHALFHFIASKIPELADHIAPIHAIPLRRSAAPPLAFLEKAEIDALLAVPDRGQAQGQRDHALLLFLYNTGARASEAAELTIGALSLAPGAACAVRLRRGTRTRECPLWPETVEVLRRLLGARLGGPPGTPVFHNVRGKPITRFGIHTLVARIAERAAQATPSLRAKRVSPHTIRHTTAIHLLRAGAPVDSVRAWLGHASLDTTSRYAEREAALRAPATNPADPANPAESVEASRCPRAPG
jgi:integrase/recombinase XerD